ncbi:MAG: hypothetical protein LBV62_00360 [Rickettsiales bacterium]|jgi:hypothetical protein|nr:hypothetical protein [Rickettsiales bacterium]
MTKIEAIKKKYNEEGFWSATEEVPVQGWNLVKENPWKTGLVIGIPVSVAVLAVLYKKVEGVRNFVDNCAKHVSAYAENVGTKISPQVAFGLAVLSVAAVVTAGALAYMNSSKVSQIDAVKEEILKVCEKDGDKLKMAEKADPLTALTNIARTVKIAAEKGIIK